MAKKILILYFSEGGTTETVADYIGEGVRIAGHEAEVRKTGDIKSPADLAGYDGYLFGCPSYHLDMPEPMKELLLLAKAAGLEGKLGGAFGMSAHPGGREGGVAAMIFEVMESELGMRMTNLGPFNLTEDLFDHPDMMRACHDYGKALVPES